MGKVVLDGETWLYPLPAVLVTTLQDDGTPNIITLAWAGIVCSSPPQLSISIQPRRYSHGLVQRRGEFVVNIPTAAQVNQVDYCGMVSGRDADKFAKCRFNPQPGTKVAVPGIVECPVQLECKVVQTLSLGSHDMFIGEIVAVTAEEKILNDRGQINPDAADPLVYVKGRYLSTDVVLGKQGVGRILR